MKNAHALVVFSGGQDSTTCLFWAKRHFTSVSCVTFNYGQRHEEELAVSQRICEELGVKQVVLDLGLLNQLAPSALTRQDVPIVHVAGELPSTFVPGRNHIFLSFAAILAQSMGVKHLVTGVCETDFSGYPDCRDSFVKSLNVTLNLAMDESFVIHTPLMWLNKAETWALADELGQLSFIKEKTLTCYNGIIGDGCGNCPACALRRQGYKQFLEGECS
ncbi:MAG: 7-cyano-7-deazaguanine synthase QueC [Bacilli bacterium]